MEGLQNNIVLIQAYFPTSSSPDEEVDIIYDQIQNIIDNTSLRDYIILMGDFNARVGNLYDSYPNNIGKHTIGNSNLRGERLASFCAMNNLYVTNTFFKKRRQHTWSHPDGIHKAQAIL